MPVTIPVHRIPVRGSCKARGRAMATVVGYAIVDDDMARLAERFWTLHPDGYAATREGGRTILMQHFVVPAERGRDVSHGNADKLDNRRENLAPASRSRNLLNTADPLTKANTSGFRGVTRDDASRRLARPWRGKVCLNGKTYQTARYATAHEAAIALNELRTTLGVPADPRVREMPALPSERTRP